MNHSRPVTHPTAILATVLLLGIFPSRVNGAMVAAPVPAKVAFSPPVLPDGQRIVRDRTNAFLKPTSTLRAEVAIAQTPPTIETMFYPGQTYAGNP